ncbi:MAG: ABC transporter ATP-binding protein [Actinobacteria bacterium]|nr:ABC transporter ATP-binding protein [Actinomycetota bacterium]
MAAIETSGLTKTFGDVVAVSDLNLVVEPGEIFGFLGPNGSGKTTTIRALLAYLRPTAGSAAILGLDCQRDSVAIRRRIGYVPAEYGMYEKLTGAQVLRYFANLRGGVDESYVAELADRFQADLDKRTRDYSSGNRQKIALIQALMNRPEVLILDEPSTGLDPLMQQVLQESLEGIRDEGGTVFLSSHTLSEVQRIADRVGILRTGELVATERVDELLKKALHRLDIEFAQPVPEADFSAIPHVRSVETRGLLVSISFDGHIADILRVAMSHEIVTLNSRDADLEEVFLTYYRDQGTAAGAQP